MEYIISSVIGYIIGCFNPAYYIGKLYGYEDIREEGSGNAGASNIGLVVGKNIGFAVAVMDICKAIFAMYLAGTVCSKIKYAKIVAGAFAITGHMFPVNMHFEGGKGLACFAGVVISVSIEMAACMAVIFAAVILLTDYLVFGVICAVIIFPVVLAVTEGILPAVVMAIISAVMIAKHRINIKRISCGLEYRISFIWDKEGRMAFKKRYEDYIAVSADAETERLVK